MSFQEAEKLVEEVLGPIPYRLLRAKWRLDGYFRGSALMVLTQLRAKGLYLTWAQHDRIVQCEDEATLEKWGTRLLTAKSVEEVLAD